MPAPEASSRHYLDQQAITAGTVARARSVWADVDLADLDGSWRDKRIGERLYVNVSAGQLLAASRADQYLDRVLDELDIDTAAAGTVSARRLAGVASDGRNLEALLYEPIITTKTTIAARGTSGAMRSGEKALVRIVATQLQDAGRTAVGVGIAARPAVSGFVRMLNPPSCSRCAVLAGRRYRWNTGFLRHPGCDCRHIPTSESVAGDLTTSPRSYFESLDAESQNRYFTGPGADAIREGADIGQVVNARRGMTTAGTTREGVTVRGFAGKRLAAARGTVRVDAERLRRARAERLMPERIFAEAGSRAEAIDLLRQHGYLL